jgi:hypothetical protein
VPTYAFPSEVRRLLYTTDAIEALNAKLRWAVRARAHFPTDDAALKLPFLVLNQSEKAWAMPAREWGMAKAQFAILFGQRFTKVMNCPCKTAHPHTKIPKRRRDPVDNGDSVAVGSHGATGSIEATGGAHVSI